MPRIQSIPYRGSTHFVGREDELAKLHDSLQQTNRVAVTAIAGMGGVGKTELAVQYALQHEAEYAGGVCWLLARSGNLAAQILQRVGLQGREVPQQSGDRLLTLNEQVQWCWETWQPDGKVLVVLDDVANLSDYQEILPHQSRFCLVMTTRVRSIDANFHEISLDVLSDEKALELLGKLLKQGDRIARDPAAATQLCKALGNLPLGLELVGRYLAKYRSLSLAEMLKRLKLEDAALQRDSQYQMVAQRGINTAFELTWQDLNAGAQEVALLLSWFAPNDIPWFLVERIMQRVQGEEYALIEPATQLDNAFLIQPAGEVCYKLHPLIREFLQVKRQAAEPPQHQQAFVDVLVREAKQVPQSPTIEFTITFAVIRPHLEAVAEAMTDRLSNEDLIWAFVGLARFYKGQGLYTLAEPWYQQCLSATQSRFGNEHPYVAGSLNNLATLYDSQGRYSEAEPLYVQALALSQQLLGEVHPDVATSLNNLAGLYRSQGRYSEAEPLYVQALALRQQLLGEVHPNVATSLNNLALLYYSQGRYSEAEPLYVQALALNQQLLGEAHPDVANSLNNLASLYSSQGRYSEAEPMYVQALALSQQLLGEAHPAVASSLNNLAELYRSQGRYSEAEPLYVQALALNQQLLGEVHPNVASSLNNLAELYRSQGRYSEAEPLYVQALALSQQLLGEAHPDVASSLNNLAALYYSQGRYSEAEPLYVQALMISEARLGANHPHTITFRQNLEMLRQQMQSDRQPPQRNRPTSIRRGSPTVGQRLRSLLLRLIRQIKRLLQSRRSRR